MGIKGGKPSERKKVRIWATRQPQPGKVFGAWSAGDAVRVCSHVASRTKPCLKRYLGESYPCVGCGNGLRRDDVFYQPLYAESDDANIVVLFHVDHMDALDSLRLHQRVSVGRGTSANRGAFIKIERDEPLYSTDRDDRQTGADIADWLPLLWKVGTIITGDHLRRGPLDEVAAPAVTPVTTTQAKVEQFFDAQEFGIESTLEEIGSLPPGEAKKRRAKRNDDFVNRIKQSANGVNGTH